MTTLPSLSMEDEIRTLMRCATFSIGGTCLPWLNQRGVAVLGGDGASDVLPSGLEDGDLPIHRIAIPGMGLHLIDHCELENLAAACAQRNRWEFFFVVAPLKLPGGTGS